MQAPGNGGISFAVGMPGTGHGRPRSHPRRCGRHKPPGMRMRPGKRCPRASRAARRRNPRTRRTRCPDNAPAATDAPRMVWAPILQGKGHGANQAHQGRTRLILSLTPACLSSNPAKKPRMPKNHPQWVKTQVPKMSQKRRFVFTILYTSC